jgi:hypothetical protein
MQRIEIDIRIRTWLVAQSDGHGESRRRSSLAERPAPNVPPEPPAEA